MKYLAPIPKQFVDQNGLPLSNGTVHVYISGDTQYANVYQDADGEELMPNPARLDSNGAWLGFVTAGVPLDYVVEDKDGNVQFEYEKVVAGNGTANVAIEPVLTSGTKIAECWVDGELLELFAPEGGGTQVQADWAQTDSSAADYIKNKPAIPSQFMALRKVNDTANASRYVKIAELSPSISDNYIYHYDLSVLVSCSTGQGNGEENESGRFDLNVACSKNSNVYYATGRWVGYNGDSLASQYKKIEGVVLLKQMVDGGSYADTLTKMEVWLKVNNELSYMQNASISVVLNQGSRQYPSNYPTKSYYQNPWVVSSGSQWLTTTAPSGDSTAPNFFNLTDFPAVGGQQDCKQFVLVRANMTTAFTDTEYQDCVDALTGGKAVCVKVGTGANCMQLQLTQNTNVIGLQFEATYGDYHYLYAVATTPGAHTISENIHHFGVPVYASLQDAIADVDTLYTGMYFETNGFHTSGDGGAARYKVSSTGTANGMDIVQLSAGKLAILQVQDFAYPDQLGYVRNDGTQDVVPYINQIFSLGILHIKLHWGRYYMRQTLSLPIASSIEGVARAAYDYPAMSRMILMTTTGDCAINASNYDVRFENFDLYCSGDLSGKIGVLTNSWDNSQRGIVFRNFKVSQFQTSIKLSNLVNWNILFDRVTFEYGDYGLWIEANKLVINLSDCYFNGIREEDVHNKQYSTALSFSHCNFGCRKKVFKNEWNNLDWRNFGEISFYGCNFEVDVYDLANVSGCFVDIDDGCQVSLSFVGCDFNVDQANQASVTCFKFGNRTRATYIGCHGKESQYVHFDGDFFDTSYPPEATPGSLVIDSTCVGLKTPTYDSAHSMSCRDEHELFESYTHVNPLNIFDNVVVNYSYAGVRDAGGGVLEFFTAPPPQSCASIVIDIPAGYRNIPLTLSTWTGTHNKWIAVATPIHPDEDRSQTPTLLADSYSTADGRDYCSINMNGNRYLLFYYYLMSADGNPEKFDMSNGLMLSEGSYHYPYVNHIVVDKSGYHISEKFIPPVKIIGRSGALPLSSCDDLVPTDTGLKIFGEVNTFGGTSGGLPTGFSGIGMLESTAMVNFTRCLQVLFGGNGKIYTRRAIRNTTSDPWTWQSWYTFSGV